MPHYAGFNLPIHQDAQQLQRQIGDYFNVGWTVIRVAHALNSHDVRALPKSVQLRICFDAVNNVLQFSVTAKRYVKNVRHLNQLPIAIVISLCENLNLTSVDAVDVRT